MLKTVKKTGADTYSLSGNYYSSETIKKIDIKIYMIDEKNKVAIWEFLNETRPEYRYGLFVAKEHMKQFDIIVNYSTEKTNEFEFDTIDYPSLLKKFNNK